MSHAFYDNLIPNNVDLSEDKKLQKALEHWHPKYMEWWMDRGPGLYQDKDIYLRTAISVDAGGWANYDFVKMPEYRWGIFLAPPRESQTIGFGEMLGKPVWDSVPGEFRGDLRRLIVTQADTEPGSVEQQRLLAQTAPSLYDLRNLFQVNVEEGRHLWAMVYLLHRFFGKDGREEADELLVRCSGDPDTPRVLNAFNEPITDWLDFFCFTMFTDRDGKYQLGALAESAFEPLSRTTRFMLTEEGFHLFVGDTGLSRIMRRAAVLARTAPGGDVDAAGGMSLPLIQRYINRWFSSSIDLFGSDDSSNSASYFASGLKGRFNERNRKLYPDPKAEGSYACEVPDGKGGVEQTSVPMRRAMNAILLDQYREDCLGALKRWNKMLVNEGSDFVLSLPSLRFNRMIGSFRDTLFDPAGNSLTDQQWQDQKDDFLPTAKDKEHVQSLMHQVIEPGQYANWISPPTKGVNKQAVDFEYVRL
jgi:benzoyl-CoA 2,3-dioxygenase component B